MGKGRFTEAEALPLVLTPMDVAAVLAISRNTAYELIHSEKFPAFRVGKQYRISRERSVAWLNGEAA